MRVIFFGDPESRGTREDALACVRMAMAMRRRLHELTVTWRAAGIARLLQTRMGVHTGFCTVGNFGSEDRLDYTIVGGAVNIAARLEELAAADEILVSFETFALIKHEIACEAMGRVEVKGIAHPIQAYRVVDADRDDEASSDRVQEALPAFRLELDLAGMSDTDRVSARTALERALRLQDRD